MRIDSKIIAKAKKLRKIGYSLPEISYECNIAKSSAFRLVNDVKILPKYYGRWLARKKSSIFLSEKNWVVARKFAHNQIKSLSNENKMILAATLYWAEGAKNDFSFINSDPKMMALFIHILISVFKIPRDNIIVSIRIYDDLDVKKCLNFWSKIVNKKLDNKTSVTILHGSKNGKLPYGICRIRVKKGGLLLKEFSSIIQRVIDLINAPVVQRIERETPKL